MEHAMKTNKFNLNKKSIEIIYMILVIPYLLFPFRWAAWMYSFFVVCQMIYYWNTPESWYYIGKIIIVWSLTVSWIWFVVAYSIKEENK